MRYIITLILGISAILTSHAQNAALSISLQDSAFFVCTIDGKAYKEPSQVVNVYDLNSGTHRIEIKKLKSMGNSTIEQPSFSGEISLEPNFRSHFQIDRFNQIKLILKENYNPEQNRTQTSRQVWVPDANKIPTNTQVITDTRGMSNSKFAEQMEVLKSNLNESQRYKLAHDMLSLGTFKSSQVAEMMLLFDAESHRVRLANEGQEHVTDPQNYSVVFEALRRPRSVRKLSRQLNN
jgi:hypothetical protein